MKTRTTAFYLSALSLLAAGTAFAGGTPDPAGLPQCLPGPVSGACLLPLKGGSFDASPGLAAWTATGDVGEADDGDPSGANRMASLAGGGVLAQAVYAHAGHQPEDVAYVLRFRARAASEGAVRAALSMSNDSATYVEPLGGSSTALGKEWRTVELMVNGKPFGAPAHVLVELAGEGDAVFVDDVYLVQSTDVEVVGR